MTRVTKFFTLPGLSIAAATALISGGIAIGRAMEVQAMYVTRPEYTKDQNDIRQRFLKDSLTGVILRSEIIGRLDRQDSSQARANRILYHLACKTYPTECER